MNAIGLVDRSAHAFDLELLSHGQSDWPCVGRLPAWKWIMRGGFHGVLAEDPPIVAAQGRVRTTTATMVCIPRPAQPVLSDFPATAPAAEAVFYRTYSRKGEHGRESWREVVERNLMGLTAIGRLTQSEQALLRTMQLEQMALPSGRWLWVGGTDWIERPENFSGAYNCTSVNLIDWEAFALMMDLAMMGCGTGAVIEPWLIKQLPKIRNKIVIKEVTRIGTTPLGDRWIATRKWIDYKESEVAIAVGDSRHGWVSAYRTLLELSTDKGFGAEPIRVAIDLSDVRPVGERLKGFGGVANPVKLGDLFGRLAAILDRAHGRQLTAVECCLLIDEAALVVVAGNIRRSAGMRQFNAKDEAAATAKDNLWQQDSEGGWRIDPERDALRMANHTRVFHSKPSREEVLASVRKQFHSGEGAIQYAPEAVARSNVDLLDTAARRQNFIDEYCRGRVDGGIYLDRLGDFKESKEQIEHRMGRYGLNPCGEIEGQDFHCNLSEVHLNRLDPHSSGEQVSAFKAATISAAALLHHRFEVERFRQSREWDPIVGVSFTGLFDFFVQDLGVDWLRWFIAGRPDSSEGDAFREAEAARLHFWREIVKNTLYDYCTKHDLTMPNRYTTVQPAGTKSLLTNASPGWHPPKAQRFIRRITFRRDDPVALACLDQGFSIVPSQSDKDEQGRLLDDPFDPRCTEWLVEIPTEVPWANLPGADEVDLGQISALAQFDFYMQVQTHYTTHNTSATIEFREHEIEPLADAIHDAIARDRGYISAALLARFDANETFPRLPFEPINKATFERLQGEVERRRKPGSFYEALQRHDGGQGLAEAGPAGCDSDKCLLPQAKP